MEAEDSGRLIVSVVVYSFIIHQDFSKSYITEVVANDNSLMEPNHVETINVDHHFCAFKFIEFFANGSLLLRR